MQARPCVSPATPALHPICHAVVGLKKELEVGGGAMSARESRAPRVTLCCEMPFRASTCMHRLLLVACLSQPSPCVAPSEKETGLTGLVWPGSPLCVGRMTAQLSENFKIHRLAACCPTCPKHSGRVRPKQARPRQQHPYPPGKRGIAPADHSRVPKCVPYSVGSMSHCTCRVWHDRMVQQRTEYGVLADVRRPA